MTMTCNHCGAEVTGSVAEVLAWDKTHPAHCTETETP